MPLVAKHDRFEFEVILKSGKIVPVKIDLSTNHDGNFYYYIKGDVTLKEAEEISQEVKRAVNQVLFDLIGEEEDYGNSRINS